MRRIKPALLALATVASISFPCPADTSVNPYLSVVDRNPFGLKPPPPPAPEAPPVPIVPMAKVVLTGITSVFGPPRAFVEITEQEPGKTPNIRKPIMQQGDREASVELISIDIANNSIRIKNGGIETNVVFEVAKTSTGPAPGPGAPPTALPMGTPQPGHLGAAASAGAPTIISSGGAAPAGRTGTAVSVFGGASPAVPSAPNAAYPSPSPAYASAANTYASSVNNSGGGVSVYGAGATTPNFSRPNRTEPNAAPTAQEVYQRMITQQQQAQQAGVMLPPLPPSPHLGTAGSGPPPLPPVPGRR